MWTKSAVVLDSTNLGYDDALQGTKRREKDRLRAPNSRSSICNLNPALLPRRLQPSEHSRPSKSTERLRTASEITPSERGSHHSAEKKHGQSTALYALRI